MPPAETSPVKSRTDARPADGALLARRSPTGGSCARSVRATAAWRTVRRDSASSARTTAASWCSSATGARPGSRSIRSRRSRSTISYPGTPVLSFGTAGCNLGCKFCQNWDISKAKLDEQGLRRNTPDEVVDLAAAQGAPSIAYTYNDPVIWAEYVIDIARAARAARREERLVTAGYVTDEARPELYADADAANVDLKAFSEEFYRKTTRVPPRARARDAEVDPPQERHLARGDDAADPRTQRQRRRARGASPPGSPRTWDRTCRCTSPRSIPTSR